MILERGKNKQLVIEVAFGFKWQQMHINVKSLSVKQENTQRIQKIVAMNAMYAYLWPADVTQL